MPSENTVLHTKRTLLKIVTPALIRRLFSEGESAVRAYFQNDDAGFAKLREMHDEGLQAYRISQCYFLIVLPETGRVIGECGFHTWNTGHHRAEAFYSLRAEEDKRKGIMSEVFPRVLDFGFSVMGLHRVEALVARDNAASIALLKRYGFTHEGTMREDYLVEGKQEDSECYSLLRQERQRDDSI